jgi:hypothetical protein
MKFTFDHLFCCRTPKFRGEPFPALDLVNVMPLSTADAEDAAASAAEITSKCSAPHDCLSSGDGIDRLALLNDYLPAPALSAVRKEADRPNGPLLPNACSPT